MKCRAVLYSTWFWPVLASAFTPKIALLWSCRKGMLTPQRHCRWSSFNPDSESKNERIIYDHGDFVPGNETCEPSSETAIPHRNEMPSNGPSRTDQYPALSGPEPISLPDLAQLSSEVAYFYLRDELGLGEEVMWKITNDAGSILGLKASNIRQKVELLQESTAFSYDDTKLLISSMPSLLQLSAKENLKPTIAYLKEHLSLETRDLRALVLGCPALLTYSIPNLERKLVFFRERMGFETKDVRKLLVTEPRLMTSSVATGLLPRLELLQQELRMPVEDIRRIVSQNPRILIMSVEHNLQPKLIFYFMMTLNLSPNDVRKILLKFPEILNYSLEGHLLPITRYFLSLDFVTHEFARMLCKFPRLVTNSLDKLRLVVEYLHFELGFDTDGVRRILYQAPQVVGLSKSTLQAKVDFLLMVLTAGTDGDKLSRKTLQKVILGMPTLLYLSIDKNLAPKIEFLRSELGEVELCSAVARLPTLLGYSLENRIKPRLRQIHDAGLEDRSLTVAITFKEETFQTWLETRQRKKQAIDRAVADLREHEATGNIPEGAFRSVTEDGKVTHWTRQKT